MSTNQPRRTFLKVAGGLDEAYAPEDKLRELGIHPEQLDAIDSRSDNPERAAYSVRTLIQARVRSLAAPDPSVQWSNFGSISRRS